MRQILIFILFIFFGSTLSLTAQNRSLDSIQVLDEIVLSDVKLTEYSKGYKITTLGDSILQKNGRSLTDLLRFNSNIYFKENGYGMVSSPSFRGTNASHTAVVWNGVNINSQLNGQVDFNTISSVNYNDVSIRSGGGSVQYGSGAIGGTVHLSNKLNFKKHLNQHLELGYGSFNTKNTNYNASFGNRIWSGSFGVGYKDSDNDYRYLGTDKNNENGEFYNLDINLNLGYVLSKYDVIKLYHQNFRSDRAFSSTLVAPSNSKYESEDYRTMLEWAHIKDKYSFSLKVVHLNEHFKYFENKALDNSSEGNVDTWKLKHHYKYQFSNKINISVITDFGHIAAQGGSFNDPERNTFSATTIWSHRATKSLQYNLSVRKDFISDFKSPLVFSGDISYLVAPVYTLKINASKNFRVPTFNDLYWIPGGNLDLESEESYQIDLGHEFASKGLNFKLNTFYIKSSNLIQWRPNSTNGYWNPVNVANAKNYGLEAEVGYKKQIQLHEFVLSANYSFTQTEDVEKQQELYYVPNHKANAAVSYGYKSFLAYYQHLYNGNVDIIGRRLDGFDVGNIGFSYELNSNKKTTYVIYLKINNLYNKYYENVALRPMPNRNFNIKLSLKF